MHILIITGFIVLFVFTLLKRIKNNINIKGKEIDMYDFELRISPLFKLISVIGSAVFGVIILLMTLIPNETVTVAIYILFSVLFLLNLILFLYFATSKIKIHVNNIICYSLLRRPRQYTFDMVKKLVINDSGNGRNVTAYGNDEKFFSFSSLYGGFDTLMLRFGEKQILTEYRQTQTFSNRTVSENMEPDWKPQASVLSITAIATVMFGVSFNILGMAGSVSVLRNIGILICVAAIVVSIVDLAISGSYKPPKKSDGSLFAILLGILVCFLNGIIFLVM